MRTILGATLRSLAFLTRLPAPKWAFSGTHSLGADAVAFPLAGVLAALPAALVLVLANAAGLSPLVPALLAVAILIAVTGALHEDGLADVADGLGGHHPPERTLQIMKDSRIGSYGTLALILSVGLRVGLVAHLLLSGAEAAALALVATAAASRGAMVWLWSSLPSANPGGVAGRAGQPDPRTGLLALLLGLAVFLVLAMASFGLWKPFAGLGLGAVVLLWFRGFVRRRLGGQTGDCLGAAQQLTEIAVLIGLALGG
ncbi:adenosylcobinamide-GDP ribazoletransferase [Aurantimonas sp. VKM B-3413]|uniref:adenosylcobinamide-GDP ribazoletransferase n=1 Tax=Aurantimonas sp. VKM B-3413 TaxID=2779401 RepID=UPI001E63C64B|nr:adenosylcobinamide-GDP ribazoletransferase [Aurantimonas sp. VKM B-3413]MCB8838644.1 adenosylcobinamide-GDP ribazoletransferase [Aurantimonas sp. VKM B-3413]